MSEQVKVSIICNVYNHEKYVADALDGFVMQQTNFPFEVLVHDDASTDSSAAIIRKYEEKYPDIIKPIYQKVNQYSQKIDITKTIQRPRAQGQYIAMCEGDDYWTDPLKLQKQVDFLDANPQYTMCATSTVWLDMRTNTVRPMCRTDVDRDISLEEIILEKKGRVFQFATIMLKAEVFCNCPDWMQYFGVGDTPMEIHAAINGSVRMLADVTAVYRNHAVGSWTSRIQKDTQYKTKVFLQMIDGYTRFNEATNFAYNQVVSRRINQIRYNIARVNKDFKAMRTGPLREIWDSRSFLGRMSDFLECKAPKLYHIIRRIQKLI